MTEFEGREKAFEKKFELDEELKFKTASRAAKLFGEWAANQLGLKSTEAELYIRKSIELSTAKAGHELLLAKVEQDFKTKGLEINKYALDKEMNKCSLVAREQVLGKP